MMIYRASVVISTKDRQDDLLIAITSCLKQSEIPEIIVIDDGSSDETSNLMRGKFPFVNYIRHKNSKGYITRRNEGAKIAKGDIIFSIDDDAEFKDSKIIENTLKDFDCEDVGAVAIPLFEPNLSENVFQRAPEFEGVWLTDSFKGTSYAVRRSVFLGLGGFRSELIHQGEERDFCIRLLNSGKFVRLGRSEPIYHYESPKRDLRRMARYGRRNDILFAWQNVPSLYLIPHMAVTIVKGLIFGLRKGPFLHHLKGTMEAFFDIFSGKIQRSPVSSRAYRRFRELRAGGQLLQSACSSTVS